MLMLWPGCGPDHTGGGKADGNVPPHNECDENGATRCSPDNRAVETCTQGENGGLEWTVSTACKAGLDCQDDTNGPHCLCPDSCEPDAIRCDGNTVQTCSDSDDDGCFEWGDDAPCADDEVCQYGICLVQGTIALYVSPQGDDAWSGSLPQPNEDHSDGPLASMIGARDTVRAIKQTADWPSPVRIFFRNGSYPITEPVEFLPEDSGTVDATISYEAFPGETPVIDGGRPVTGWTVADGRWTTTIRDVASQDWSFAALWVDDVRRPRARTPNEGYRHIAGTATPANQAFAFQPGDMEPWSNLDDVVVEVFHSWATSLHHIASIDTSQHIVSFTGPARWDFGRWDPAQRYIVHNVYEALDEPGEWYLDRHTGVLTYLPKSEEDPASATVVAPVAKQFIVISGDPASNQFVEHIIFYGITFLHTDWQPGPAGSSAGQAAVDLPAAIEITGGRHIAVDHCRIGHTGTYGLWFRSGTQDSQVVQTEFFDLGGGGVRIGEQQTAASPAKEGGNNRVDNCFIHDGSVILSAAVGVWIGRSSSNSVTHNDIGDLDYTGISVGWSWGYAASTAHDNIIADNHIHHIGRSVLSDMGGIYTLGVSPGTTLEHNEIHDIFSYRSGVGAWGIYLDEGSSNIAVRNNLVYNTKTGGFHQHYGQDNDVSNNIFAFSHECQIRRSREEDHISFSFTRNIVLYNDAWLLDGTWQNDNFTMDSNLYWDLSGNPILFGCSTMAQWQATGHDTHSVAADPLMSDPYGLDFTLSPQSPALALGFVPFAQDNDDFGLYGNPVWVALPDAIQRTEEPLPADATPQVMFDGFEDTPVGQKAGHGAVTSGETAQATVRVTDEQAAHGVHSLKFQDAAGLDHTWVPYFAYFPTYFSGTIQGSFAVRLGPGAIFYHEWRDQQSPYDAGPHITIDAQGLVAASGQDLVTVARNEWVQVRITFDVGPGGNGLYDITLTSPTIGTQTFTGLGNPGAVICGLRWVVFVSNADAATVMYIDDVSFQAL